jgi:type IV secretion system protein VirB6
MNPQIFTVIEQAIEAPVERAMDNVISALSAYLQSPMLAAFAMYVALIGIAILRGAVTDTFGDMLGRILKFALIAWLVMNASAYVTYIRNLFIDTLPNDLTTAVANAGNGQQLASASFDQLFNKAYVLGLQIWQQASWDDFGPILAVLIFWVVSLIVAAFMFVLFLYARFGLDLVIAVGPIFVCFALFNQTRMLFERWSFTALHYVVLQIFIVVVLQLLTAAAGREMDQIIAASGSAIDRIGLLLALIGMFFVFGILAKQLDPIVTSITGGATFHAAEISRYTLGAARVGAERLSGMAGATAAQLGRRGARSLGSAAMSRLRPNTVTAGTAPRPIPSSPLSSRT